MQSLKNKSNEKSGEIFKTAGLWIKAVAAADLNVLSDLMTEDIIVIHGSGRTITGKRAVIEDFSEGFKKFSIKQSLIPEEIIISGKYAFDRSRVLTSLVDRTTGVKKEYVSETLTILRNESKRWKVARSIGVLIQEKNQLS